MSKGIHYQPLIPPTLKDIIVSMRPTQWSKNIVALAAFFFAYWDTTRAAPLSTLHFLRAIVGFILFCLVSSGIYIINDLHDAPMDRLHPVKKLRPFAAGRLPASLAGIVSGLLISVGLAGAVMLSLRYAAVVAAYVIMQICYTFFFKRLPFVDALVIAAGFVIRAVAGAYVLVDVIISQWLLLCAFLLSLFLALCKRRSEMLLNASNGEHLQRPSLSGYNQKTIDILIAVTGFASFIAYFCYSLWPGTVAKFQTRSLVFTAPFVALGLLRYTHLVYNHSRGERPEEILFSDKPLLAIIFLYGASAIAILYFRPW